MTVVGKRLTSKQVSLLRYACGQTGRRTDKQILEWAEYQAGVGFYEKLEDIPMSSMETMMKRLRQEGIISKQ